MDVRGIRSRYDYYSISCNSRSDSEFLSVSAGSPVLRCSANAGNLRAFYEDSHLEQSFVRLGHFVIIKTSKIPTLAAASSRRVTFRFGSSDPVSGWVDCGDSVPLPSIWWR